jgi:hypothetical protein
MPTRVHAPFTLKLSEQDEVIILVGADRINLGSRAVACEEMIRFLGELDFEERV